jgi:hypothetical protein
LTTPDLFAAAWARKEIAPPVGVPTPAKPEASAPRIVLPRDLPAALKRLDDRELRRLSEAVLEERAARGDRRVTGVEKSSPKRVESSPVSLSTGKINAVRAAFKAGVKPAQIARQFGISQLDVRKVLASDAKKR